MRETDPRPAEGGAPLRVESVTFLLIRDRCLLMERCPKKARQYGNGAEWFTPGGRVEDGDLTPEHAALREAREELGVLIRDLRPLPMVDAAWPGNAGPFLMQPFVVGDWYGELPSHCLDHPDVPLRWVPLTEAAASPTYAVRAMIAALLAAPSPESAPEPEGER